MGNGNITGEKKFQKRKSIHVKSKEFEELFTRRKSATNLIFYACTDKARVITEILEERGWSRTKDLNGTNFTIKWCLEHQVDWKEFQEGKQLINNIPGQITFADKVNLWYTIRDYISHRQTLLGNNIQTFLPRTFVLDNNNEVAEFLRVYKKQNKTWISKPRYSYAGQGIHVISVNSDLETVFKVKSGIGNRIQHQPKLPGYLMQEYISRPLLLKGRKFDIRVHWLVAWTKPLLVFYNHHASVIRLSLNLYREFDFDRATHLTNLSIQENHYRYAFSQEATGMTMQQLNHYFNQCFRPFHPKMCQDWVLTVMQDRMHTIIRQVIRASKDKLDRKAGHFGLFGCDFLLDENFRLWLLEVNDNPGVGWGNSEVNTTTKPLFEETLNIVFECFEKYKSGRQFLPFECLKNYQLIYNENNDVENLLHDDNQVFSERIPTRYSIRDLPSRSSSQQILPRVNTSRTSTTTPMTDTNTISDIVLPIVPEISSPKPSHSIVTIERPKPSEINSYRTVNSMIIRERFKRIDPDDAHERLVKLKALRARYTFSIQTHALDKLSKTSIKRSFSSSTTFSGMQRKKRIDLKPISLQKKRNIPPNTTLIPVCTELHNKEEMIVFDEERKENTMMLEEDEQEQQSQLMIPSTIFEQSANEDASVVCSVY